MTGTGARMRPMGDARWVFADADLWLGLARAVAGALLFGLPVFMTSCSASACKVVEP